MAVSLVSLLGDRPNNPFQRWWETRGEWVEPPNQRRDGESGVQRIQLRDQGVLYCKRQVGHLYRTLLHPFGRPTVLREHRALMAFARVGVKVPEQVYCAAERVAGEWRAVLVTEALEGFVSLDQWYAEGLLEQWGEAVHQQMLEGVAATLARIHQARWQHGCCYPKHLFIKVHPEQSRRVEVAVLDLEKSRRRLSRTAASRHDLRQLDRHRQGMPDQDWNHLVWAYMDCVKNPGPRIQKGDLAITQMMTD